MTTAELVQTFRDADWTTPEALERQLAGLPPLDAAQLARLLDVLTNRWAASEPQRQERRCQAFARLAEQVLDRELFLPYVKALRIPDPQLRSVLCSLLPLVNSVRDHPELCELLRSDDADLRQRAALVMGRVGSRAMCERLGELVAEPGLPGRLEAMEVLRILAGHRALEPYETVLSPEAAEDIDRPVARRHLGQDLIEPVVVVVDGFEFRFRLERAARHRDDAPVPRLAQQDVEQSASDEPGGTGDDGRS